MKTLQAARVVCIADRRVTEWAEEEILSMGIRAYHSEPCKQLSLRGSGMFGRRTRLEETPSDVLQFFVPRGQETVAMRRVAAATDLQAPGRGSLFAEAVTLYGEVLPEFGDEPAEIEDPAWARSVPERTTAHNLIRCVVQRGRGAEVAAALLERGLCVPTIAYGIGAGLRERLGLLQIAIPKEKEVVLAVVPGADGADVAAEMAQAGRLKEEGSGFLCRTRVQALATNMRIYRENERRHVASMEQLISAVDMMRGNTEWRRRWDGAAAHDGGGRSRGMKRISLACEEGRMDEALKAVLEVEGVGGATQMRMLRQYRGAQEEDAGPEGNEAVAGSHAWQQCDLVMGAAAAHQIPAVLEATGFFGAEVRGLMEETPVLETAGGRTAD